MMLLLSNDDLREDRRHVVFEQVDYFDLSDGAKIAVIAVGCATYAERKDGECPKFKKIFSPQELERYERSES